MTKVWVTKYALSTGILMVHAEISCEGRMAAYRLNGGYMQSVHGKDWHLSWPLALQRALDMRANKILSHKKSIRTLEELTFKEPTHECT